MHAHNNIAGVVTMRRMRSTLSDGDKGKRVVTSSGEEVGMIKKVVDEGAFVEPDPGITESTRSRLGWGEVEKDDWELISDRVERITDDEVVLKD
jgi:hypothetical protein